MMSDEEEFVRRLKKLSDWKLAEESQLKEGAPKRTYALHLMEYRRMKKVALWSAGLGAVAALIGAVIGGLLARGC